MKALILAAGYATRLYPLTKDRPKPLLLVSGRPIIEYTIEKLVELDFLNKIYVVTNRKFYSHFQEWKNNFSCSKEIEIINDGTVSEEDRLGAIGDIEFVIRNKEIRDDLLIVAGDNLFDLKFKNFIAFFEKKGISIVSYDINNWELAKKYGVVAINAEGKVVSFEEKPAKPKSTLISMGVYAIPAKHLSLTSIYTANQANNTDQPGNYVKWLSEEHEVYSFVHRGKWYDIGDFDSLKKADQDISS